jgi:hypothetical protein
MSAEVHDDFFEVAPLHLMPKAKFTDAAKAVDTQLDGSSDGVCLYVDPTFHDPPPSAGVPLAEMGLTVAEMKKRALSAPWHLVQPGKMKT